MFCVLFVVCTYKFLGRRYNQLDPRTNGSRTVSRTLLFICSKRGDKKEDSHGKHIYIAYAVATINTVVGRRYNQFDQGRLVVL